MNDEIAKQQNSADVSIEEVIENPKKIRNGAIAVFVLRYKGRDRSGSRP